jgi:hypothetical protein
MDTHASTFYLGFTEIEDKIWHYTQSKYQGCTNPVRLIAQATNFYMVAPNTFSIITEVLSYAKKMTNSSHALSRKRQTTGRFTGHSRNVDHFGPCCS